MILNWLKLKNIRSYVDQELNFPEGSILLNGDIGAGKTTILLAVEFALFGLLRGDTTGTTLLRHGTREGSVSFCFSLNNQEVVITRTLKKIGNTINQVAGSIVINGQEKEATVLELKSIILELLGYPASLLTKNTSLIYRYTVYTPQETMKAILFEEADARLDILRKIFGMDKYKRIQEHCSKYLKYIRDKQKNVFSHFQDLPEKEQYLTEKKKEIQELYSDLTEKKPLLDKIQTKIARQREYFKHFEKQRETYHQLESQFIRYEEQLAGIIYQRNQAKERINYLSTFLSNPLPNSLSLEMLEETVHILQEEIYNLTQQHTKSSMTLGSFQAKIQAAQETLQQLQDLEHCPLCLQDVTLHHKEKVRIQQQKQARDHQQVWEETKQTLTQLEKEIIEKKQTLDQKRNHLKDTAHLQAQHVIFLDKKKEKERLEEQLFLDQERIATINKEKLRINSTLFNAKKEQEEHVNLQKEYEQLLQEEKMILMQVHGTQQALVAKQELITTLEKEIQQKQYHKQTYEQLKTTHQWLAGHFIPLIESMERHVMTKLYHDFNDRFQTWFSMLVEDEMLQARLDSSFTPVIIQNGYETELSNLSGGEKTSCSLAYRLALTRVINDLLDTIQTKDLLILDEPTDGFSAQQIDKIGEVLDELHLKQIIIVSHEPKIESFVEHLITVHKDGHESTIN